MFALTFVCGFRRYRGAPYLAIFDTAELRMIFISIEKKTSGLNVRDSPFHQRKFESQAKNQNQCTGARVTDSRPILI